MSFGGFKLQYISDFFSDLIGNYIFICAIIGWFAAQFIKCITYLVKNRRLTWRVITASGGMPSSHSSTACAMVAAVVKQDGVGSTAFAIAFVLAFIVMYDAAGIRRAAGEHAKVINRMATDISDGDENYLDGDLKELLGHTPLQVAIGALLGIVISVLIPVF